MTSPRGESKPVAKQATLRKNQMVEKIPSDERNKENYNVVYLTPDKSNQSLDASELNRSSTTNLFDEQIQSIERMLILHKKSQEEHLTEPKNHDYLSVPSSPTMRERAYYQYVCSEESELGKYTGEKYIGKRHGKGVFHYKEGYKYEGGWQNDEMSGYGVLVGANGRVLYAGEWQKGKFHGRGTLYNQDPSLKNDRFDGTNFERMGDLWLKYEGSFSNAKKNGIGTVALANGDLFVGSFVNDVVHGQGSYTKADGTTIIGSWQNNKLVSRF